MKITEEYLQKFISAIQYYHFPFTNITVCCIICTNGYSEIGYSACIDPNEFDEELGKQYAKENAEKKLKEKLAFYLKSCED